MYTAMLAALCAFVFASPAFATGEIEQLTAVVHSQSGSIGETVIVPVEVEIPTLVSNQIARCVVTLEYAKNSLVCLSEEANVSYGAALAEAEISLLVESVENSSGVALINVPFLITLGDTDIADLRMTDIRWEVRPDEWMSNGSGEFAYTFGQGTITVEDVYRFQDGSKRLLTLPFATAHAGPNPFVETTTLYISNPESSIHCDIYSLHGELVYSLGQLEATADGFEHEISLSNTVLPASGLYIVVLTNGAELTSFSLMLR